MNDIIQLQGIIKNKKKNILIRVVIMKSFGHLLN